MVEPTDAESSTDFDAHSQTMRRLMSGRRFDDIRWVDEVGSTNAELMTAARDGAGEQVLIADFQSAGRGRRDRSWASPRGSALMMSILLRSSRASGFEPAHAGRLTFALGLAAADACQRITQVRPTLKWPNDLVHEDRKLAGILAESLFEGGAMSAVVIGMGLNANWPELPTELAQTAVSLNHLAGAEVDRVALAQSVLDRFEYWLGADPRHLLGHYEANSATLGREVAVELPAERITGRAVGISLEGHLEIETAAGHRSVTVGDVVHLRPVRDQ